MTSSITELQIDQLIQIAAPLNDADLNALVRTNKLFASLLNWNDFWIERSRYFIDHWILRHIPMTKDAKEWFERYKGVVLDLDELKDNIDATIALIRADDPIIIKELISKYGLTPVIELFEQDVDSDAIPPGNPELILHGNMLRYLIENYNTPDVNALLDFLPNIWSFALKHAKLNTLQILDDTGSYTVDSGWYLINQTTPENYLIVYQWLSDRGVEPDPNESLNIVNTVSESMLTFYDDTDNKDVSADGFIEVLVWLQRHGINVIDNFVYSSRINTENVITALLKTIMAKVSLKL